MRRYVERNQTTLPGWDKKKTTKPTTRMLMHMFSDVQTVKRHQIRILCEPLNKNQEMYLEALGLTQEIFICPAAPFLT